MYLFIWLIIPAFFKTLAFHLIFFLLTVVIDLSTDLLAQFVCYVNGVVNFCHSIFDQPKFAFLWVFPQLGVHINTPKYFSSKLTLSCPSSGNKYSVIDALSVPRAESIEYVVITIRSYLRWSPDIFEHIKWTNRLHFWFADWDFWAWNKLSSVYLHLTLPLHIYPTGYKMKKIFLSFIEVWQSSARILLFLPNLFMVQCLICTSSYPKHFPLKLLEVKSTLT